jgi:electron transfer flavoprotein alpha subunit
MTAGATDVWVVVAAGVGTPSRLIAELLGEAQRLARADGGEPVALLIGSEDVAATSEELASWGAERILRCRGSQLGTFNPELFAGAIAVAIHERGPRAVLFPGTSIGVDLGLRTGLRLKRRFVSHCVDFTIAADHLDVTRPAPGGLQVTERIERAPYLVSLVSDTIGSEAPEPGRTAVTEDFACPATSSAAVRDGGFVAGDPKTIDLVDADVIIAGGRGLASAEGFRLIEEVAELLGGSVGASRPAVESGWAPYERQVGQTGRTVTPKLYMACGISGATQHLAGMREAQTIIAVNTDPGAPINAIAKLAVVGDVGEVLRALAQMLHERTGARAA